MTKKDKNKKKWHRAHFFAKENKNINGVTGLKEHPVYVFEQSHNSYKVIPFSHSPTTNGKDNLPLKHNIDPEGVKTSYGVRYTSPRSKSEFKPADKAYVIHKDDYPTIKALKSLPKSIKKKKEIKK